MIVGQLLIIFVGLSNPLVLSPPPLLKGRKGGRGGGGQNQWIYTDSLATQGRTTWEVMWPAATSIAAATTLTAWY